MTRMFENELHVSCDHMGEADLEIISERGARTSMIAAVGATGTILYVDFYSEENDADGDVALQLREDGYSAEFVDMVRWAAAHGARTLRLDAEGAIIDDLPILADELNAAPGR